LSEQHFSRLVRFIEQAVFWLYPLPFPRILEFEEGIFRRFASKNTLFTLFPPQQGAGQGCQKDN
jgi:hypothetical protein